ncbi:uncharacterized protein LOC113215125 [Frankliniella occidentalis]|uniref:Uncharacterized protein LOC113215125 n=1 Tax=Frankliniella occidentalis TaxID=133901 RepID=A0A9C6XWN0_FRAOC|nr:uncharacterized protein LOC113215125 [Frankliniella occidentalis]
MASGEVIVCRGAGDACVRRWSNASHAGDAYTNAFNEISGQVLTVAYDTLIPYVTFERRGDRLVLTGYLGELWTVLQTTLGFRSVFVRVNGNGARSMLQRGTADVYLSATVVTTDEDDVFDHTQPVVTHWYELFARKGLPEVSADSYVRAMTPTMWALTGLALVVLCLVLRAMLWLRAALGMPPGVLPHTLAPDMTVLPHTASLGSCFLSVLGGLCSQGWQESPSCLSVRVTVVTTLFFGYLLYNSYAAVLISHLASGHYTAPFGSLDDVERKGTHTLCVRNESYAYFSLLKRSAQWRRVLNRGVCRDVSQAARLAEALCEHTEAVVLEIPSVMAAALDARPECQGDVLRVKTRMQRASASLLLRPGFPYVQAIDYMCVPGACPQGPDKRIKVHALEVW